MTYLVMFVILISFFKLTSYSVDLHISPDWDDIQIDGIILETFAKVFSKATYSKVV